MEFANFKFLWNPFEVSFKLKGDENLGPYKLGDQEIYYSVLDNSGEIVSIQLLLISLYLIIVLVCRLSRHKFIKKLKSKF